MRQDKALTARPSLEDVRKRFEAWRQTKECSSSPIPEPLWDAAVELAHTHSIVEVARALRLDYNHLKKRVSHCRASCQPLGTPEFVELSIAREVPECILEGERADGARMRLSVKGALDPQIAEVAKAFWRMG